MTNRKKTVAIVGGGTAGLMLATQLDETLFDITIYEKNAATGRKFLVAGDGGLNITHSENIKDFALRYHPTSFFKSILNSFSNTDLRSWLQSIGIETYVGTSKRVFPVKGTKPIDVLNAILKVLEKKNIRFKYRHEWNGWDNENLLFSHLDNDITVKADVVVFALGGSSWRVTGSDGSWGSYFIDRGVTVVPFESSNCAFEIKWPQELLKKIEGHSLKNISLYCGVQEKKGEVVITRFGLEGGAIYALSGSIREQLKRKGDAEITIDFKPSISFSEVESKLRKRGRKSLSNYLKTELHLSDTAIALIKNYTSKEDFTSEKKLAEKIKNLTLSVISLAPIDEAISTIGGISLDEIDANFQLKKIPNHYAIGEMLDWDAPTGGYLLQGCTSMGHMLGKVLCNR